MVIYISGSGFHDTGQSLTVPRPEVSCLVSILCKERIPIVGCRNKGVLDGARAGPADEVPQAAGLVVGAAGAGAAEGLHSDHGSCGLVVHVVVAGCVAQLVVGNLLGLQAVAEESAGEGVR